MRFRFLLIPLLALTFLGAASKPRISIRFHATADARDGEPFTMPVLVKDSQVTVARVPIVSEQDVDGAYPFRAADGTFGCAFKLDENGKVKLETDSLEKRGGWIIVLVNARVVTAMKIDKPVRNGKIAIMAGLTEKEIKLIRKQFRILGAKKTFGNKLREAYYNR